ncbi:hypothetical protein CLV76_101402 [Marivita geojedonensis]|uniref:hypothetical protein n=1 Tax=Marivita geojedonensis TaxID=1123756 RepID=UPI000A20053F|nr:hypothetical protein [Marivita geojedonensis]PRY81862.1 hypothetical protein CLV76_101402 [Marivita geojedonensis]
MTLISVKLGAALLGAALLSGCDGPGTLGSMSLLESGGETPTALLASTRLGRGEIVVFGPDGYCIDPATLRTSGSRGFAAIASCHILSGGTTGPIVEPVLVTVTVGPATTDAPTPQDLAAALATELLEFRELSALDVGRFASGGESAFNGSAPVHWRGSFSLGPHLIGLTLYAPEGSPLLGTQGAAFLNTVSSRIRAKSEPTSTPSAEQSQASADPLAKRLTRLFGRGNL